MDADDVEDADVDADAEQDDDGTWDISKEAELHDCL